jgi:hypothetical protein
MRKIDKATGAIDNLHYLCKIEQGRTGRREREI